MTKSTTTKQTRSASHAQSATPQDLFEHYQVIVQCRNEAEQRRLYERLRLEGYACRLTML
jgi:hypothetical protein